MSCSKFRSFKAANYGINEDSPHVNIRRNYPKDSPYVDLYEQVYDRCEPDPDSVLVIEWGMDGITFKWTQDGFEENNTMKRLNCIIEELCVQHGLKFISNGEVQGPNVKHSALSVWTQEYKIISSH